VLNFGPETREKDLIIVKRRRYHVQDPEFDRDIWASPEQALSAAPPILSTNRFISTPEFLVV
jgi:hypothetical protein